jgi:hypothetical protein
MTVANWIEVIVEVFAFTVVPAYCGYIVGRYRYQNYDAGFDNGYSDGYQDGVDDTKYQKGDLNV